MEITVTFIWKNNFSMLLPYSNSTYRILTNRFLIKKAATQRSIRNEITLIVLAVYKFNRPSDRRQEK